MGEEKKALIAEQKAFNAKGYSLNYARQVQMTNYIVNLIVLNGMIFPYWIGMPSNWLCLIEGVMLLIPHIYNTIMIDFVGIDIRYYYSKECKDEMVTYRKSHYFPYNFAVVEMILFGIFCHEALTTLNVEKGAWVMWTYAIIIIVIMYAFFFVRFRRSSSWKNSIIISIAVVFLYFIIAWGFTVAIFTFSMGDTVYGNVSIENVREEKGILLSHYRVDYKDKEGNIKTLKISEEVYKDYKKGKKLSIMRSKGLCGTETLSVVNAYK